jgi:hypothetical protein
MDKYFKWQCYKISNSKAYRRGNHNYQSGIQGRHCIENYKSVIELKE